MGSDKKMRQRNETIPSTNIHQPRWRPEMSGLYQSQAEVDDDEEVTPWHRGNLGIILWRGGGVGVKVRQSRVSDPMILRHATTFSSAFFLPAPFHIQFLRKACYRQDVASFLMCYNRSRRVHLEHPCFLHVLAFSDVISIQVLH